MPEPDPEKLYAYLVIDRVMYRASLAADAEPYDVTVPAGTIHLTCIHPSPSLSVEEFLALPDIGPNETDLNLIFDFPNPA